MFKNYLTVTFRNIKKRKLHSLINILGLSVALTAFILIMLWVQDELSYDRYNLKADRIYRMTTSIKDANGTLYMAMTASTVRKGIETAMTRTARAYEKRFIIDPPMLFGSAIRALRSTDASESR